MIMEESLPHTDKARLETIFDTKEKYNKGLLSFEDARKILHEKVGKIAPYEVALVEQRLKEFSEDECRKEDIKGMLTLFEGLLDTARPALHFDHPVMHYYRENDAARKILLEIEDLVQYPLIKNQWLDIYERLPLFKIHCVRKQNQLYSLLEKKGFDRPTTTMWTFDDFICDEIRRARTLLDEEMTGENEEKFISLQSEIIDDMRDLMTKEETILYPTSLAMISEAEFEAMQTGDEEIGFAWIETAHSSKQTHGKHTATGEASELAKDLARVLRRHGIGNDAVMDVATGQLTLEQINLIYKHLPVDISYVDENDMVRFYSDTEHRVFPRSPNVIGRDVKNCHPRKSVHIVEEILEKFRSGEQKSAEFWINKSDIFIYIKYIAVHDEAGKFRGVLEMMQDCTHIRSLEGSRTLLTWENEEAENLKKETEDNEKTVEDSVSLNKMTVKEASINAASEKKAELKITEDTFLKDIFASYPDLKGRMSEIHPMFAALKTPLARIMLPKATIRKASERTGMSIDKLIVEIKKRCEEYDTRNK